MVGMMSNRWFVGFNGWIQFLLVSAIGAAIGLTVHSIANLVIPKR
jgi:hypothetical protein